jgi:hypothetical protein
MVIGPDARYGLSGITFPAEGGIIDGEIYMKTQIKKFGRRGFGGRLCSALVGLILPISAAAQMFQWPVTPNQLEYSNFVFVVTTLATNGGTDFHVTITTKTAPIQPDSAALVAVVTGTAAVPTVATPDPAVTVTLKRTDRRWFADFTAPGELLNNPAAYFVFVVTDYTTNPDGTRSYLPTDRMYELRLQDFAPQ